MDFQPKIFNLFSTKIYGIHIKYRNNFFSQEHHILRKDFPELKFIIKNIDKLENCEDITFQTFKSKNKFIKDMVFLYQTLIIMFKNKFALITGAGGLLGVQHAGALAEIGFNIVLLDIKKKRKKVN